MNIEKIKAYTCPVEAAMDVVGGKHKERYFELTGVPVPGD